MVDRAVRLPAVVATSVTHAQAARYGVSLPTKGRRLPATKVLRDSGLCVEFAWAAGFAGRHAHMGPWLDAAEHLIRPETPSQAGWHTLQAAASTMRAREDVVRAEPTTASAAIPVELETDPTVIG